MYKTGEKAPMNGVYQFVKYVDGSLNPSPTANEKEIILRAGEVFPPIKSSEKAAYWKWHR